MKNFLIIAVSIIILSQYCYSQRIKFKTDLFAPDKYSIDNSGFNNVHGNIEEIQDLMRKCPESLDRLQSYIDRHSAANVFSFISVIGIGYPIGVYLSGSQWQDYYSPLLLGGCIILAIGILIENSAILSLEEAGELYNRTITHNRIDYNPKFYSGYSIQISGKIIGISISF